MTRYAESTGVAPERSRAEIEATLKRYGADGFMYGWQDDHALIAFRLGGRQMRFVMAMPDPAGRDLTHTATGKARTPKQAKAAYEQAVRQRWRALALVIKAKLEAVESGITTIEDEFLAHIVLPDGQSVGQWMRPQIRAAYKSGDMPMLLPYHGGDNG